MNVQTAMNSKTGQRSKHTGILKKNLSLVLLTIPGIIFVFIFSYLPMPGIIIAFKNIQYDKGILGSPWVGLRNFEFFFKSQDAWVVTRNTILYNFTWIILGTIVSVLFALMMYEITKKIFIKFYQTVFFFPYFISWVVASFMLYAFLNYDYGILNNLFKNFGIEPFQWYSKAEYWPGILTAVYLWKSIGYTSIIYYAALVGIDREYFEAAAIDGASKWQMTRKISIPFLSPMIILLILLSIGNIIRADFGMFFYLTRDVSLLYSTTNVIDTYVFRSLRNVGDVGMSSAVGLYQSLVGFLLVIISNTLVKKYDPERSLF